MRASLGDRGGMSDRMWAAWQLSDHPDVCAALMGGVGVPRGRLRADVLNRIGEATTGEPFVLTDRHALRIEITAAAGETVLNTELAAPAEWLERASDLLDEPDPGPTPFAVEQLLVDQAIVMIVGPPKAGKTWTALELASALVTGRDAFDTFAIGNPGPIIIVLEESGRDALHRRLDALTRGHALA